MVSRNTTFISYVISPVKPFSNKPSKNFDDPFSHIFFLPSELVLPQGATSPMSGFNDESHTNKESGTGKIIIGTLSSGFSKKIKNRIRISDCEATENTLAPNLSLGSSFLLFIPIALFHLCFFPFSRSGLDQSLRQKRLR